MTADEETTHSISTSHLDSDEEPTDLSSEGQVGTDNSSLITLRSSFENFATTTREDLKQSSSLNSLNSVFDESCDKDFPDEFFLFPSDCGNIGLILGDDDWEKIETNNSSQESLTSDDGGICSTCIESGHGYGVNCDVDSKASSHSSCHSPVPKEVVSCLSCDSDEDPITLTTSGCVDQTEKSHQEDGEMNWSDHGSSDQWSVKRNDTNSQTTLISCTSCVSYDNEFTNNRLCDLACDEDSVDLDQGVFKHHLTTLFHHPSH